PPGRTAPEVLRAPALARADPLDRRAVGPDRYQRMERDALRRFAQADCAHRITFSPPEDPAVVVDLDAGARALLLVADPRPRHRADERAGIALKQLRQYARNALRVACGNRHVVNHRLPFWFVRLTIIVRQTYHLCQAPMQTAARCSAPCCVSPR